MNMQTGFFSGWRIVLAAAVALFTALPLHAETVRGEGPYRTEARPVAGTTAVVLSLPIRVSVVIGEREEITLSGDESLLPLIETVVDNGVLQIRPVRRNLDLRPRQALIAVLNVRSLTRATIAGSGELRLPAYKTPQLELSISGSGDIHLRDTEIRKLSVSISGSGNVRGSGSAEDSSIRIAGSGDVRLEDLQAKTVEVRIAGSGDARVNATETLTVRIAGSGDVRYRGEPKLSKSIAGSGEVSPLK
ncbi:head GIN domain-containing protein [Piscinibacterium candidicorallinum]|uniref:Head GIN domain-containing protein n=1 Tax=Piscinibacterium candidicorallinum TaxID=1793872 RepID=A0ABV7H2E3_9BURK